MDQYKIEQFFKDFPFLMKIQTGSWCAWPGDEWCKQNACTEASTFHTHPRLINRDEWYKVEEVRVSRVSRELLKMKPKRETGSGSMIDYCDEERAFLLGGDGEVLTEVEQDRHHYDATFGNSWREGETVGEALLRVSNPDDVAYVVLRHTGYRIQNHHSVGGYTLTLYKPPKSFTLLGWLKEQEHRAKAQIKAMVAEIDAEA